MTSWKDVLCLLAIFVAYGLAGHLDYQDVVAMEEAMRDDLRSPCIAPPCATPEGAARSQPDGLPARLGTVATCSPSACKPDDQ